MATVVVERELHCSADHAWELLEDVANLHHAFPGIVRDSQLDGDGIRTVTFDSGVVVREAIVGIEDARRRVAYSILGGRFGMHAASMQVVPRGDGAQLLWISDFRPDSAAPVVQGLMERGGDAFSAAVSATVH
jgi:carbon monoxide dehydrogenase subunit G